MNVGQAVTLFVIFVFTSFIGLILTSYMMNALDIESYTGGSILLIGVPLGIGVGATTGIYRLLVSRRE